jgi:hypothetical protein
LRLIHFKKEKDTREKQRKEERKKRKEKERKEELIQKWRTGKVKGKFMLFPKCSLFCA